MARQITDEEMADAIRAALATTPAGLVSVTVDGTTTQWDRLKALQELEKWERRASRTAGRPIIRGLNISNAF